MKPQRNQIARLALVITAGLLAAGSASAQSFSYFYGQNQQTGAGSAAVAGGTYTDTAALPAGFNGGTIRDYDNDVRANGALGDDLLSTNSPNGNSGAANPANPGFSQTWTLGSSWGQNHTGLGTEVIDSVTLYLFVNIVSPNSSANPFTLYSGLLGTEGTPGPSFTITETTDEGAFYGISIPVALAQAGFSIGVNGAFAPTHSFSTFGESYVADVTKRPGFAVQTHIVIPEPSAALLGGLGSLLLLRRRRA